MKTTTLLKIFFAVAFAAKEVYSALNCREDHCINCVANANYTHKCTMCRYARTTLDGDCSGGISIDNCESFTEFDNLCKHCKEDYYLTTDGKACKKIDISKCRFGFLDTFDSKVKCDACDGTYPSNDHVNCTTDEVPDACKYGGHAKNRTVIFGSTAVAKPEGERYCWACKKGWSRSANSTQCVSACAHGCYYCDIDNICTSCDKYNGYYEVWRSRDYGYPKCEHSGHLLFLGVMLLISLLGFNFAS